MNPRLILHTIEHLRFRQIAYQIIYRIHKPKWKPFNAPTCECPILTDSISKYSCFDNNQFEFLNIKSDFNSWNDSSNGMLWVYNLNYMDWLNQDGITFENGRYWINKFIDDFPQNKVGKDPYPIALRTINWIKFIVTYRSHINDQELQKWNNSLYSQYKLLMKKLEYHLMGNHLLEDAYSLFIGSIYFTDKKMYRKSSKLLHAQLNEQILPDGAHYEQSPMYHCILLDRLLDCYNISVNNPMFDGQQNITEILKGKAEIMLGHLESIIFSNQSISLLNDSANGIAPTPIQLFEYAKRLNLEWHSIGLKECGYKKFSTNRMEAIVDVGNITATYQPGHTHADTFNYELRISGKPFIIDTGISTYNKTARRQFERSSAAHNTVAIDNRDSSEVWGGFRVGKRAKVTVIDESDNYINAIHNGFDPTLHQRSFRLAHDNFEITDKITGSGNAKSYLHFAPNIIIKESDDKHITTNMGIIEISGNCKVTITDGAVSTEYNKLIPSKIAVIEFTDTIKYTIK